MAVVKKESIPVKIGANTFYAHKVTQLAHSKVSEKYMTTGATSRTKIGYQPYVFVAEFYVLPDDRESFEAVKNAYIYTKISSFSISGKSYSNMMITNFKLDFSDESFVGKCIIQLTCL